jgi:hypothetical protein
MHALQTETAPVVVGLRLDVDMDPLAALRMVRHNARYGVPSSVYLLHTSYYYGTWAQDELRRNPLLEEWLTGMLVAGCEVGLHTDPLQLFVERGVDGIDAVRTELAWLRSRGVSVIGTAAHNSYLVYGGENFELFAGRNLWGRTSLTVAGRRIPLGVASEADLGLTYEANYPVCDRSRDEDAIEAWARIDPTDAVRSAHWMRFYLLGNPCYRRDYQATVWHVGGDCWCFVHTPTEQMAWGISVDEAVRRVSTLPDGSRAVVWLHPAYFSRDMPEDAANR